MSLFILANTQAFASNAQLELGPYMTLEGSTTQKTNNVFGWNEKPFVFAQWGAEVLNQKHSLNIGSLWKYGTQVEAVDFARINLKKNPVEDSLAFWDGVSDWDKHKKIGEWTVYYGWFNLCGAAGVKRLTFTVTPEPVSCMLFLLGGSALAAGKYIKSRKRSR